MADDVRTMLGLRRRCSHLINGDPTTHGHEIVPNDGALRLVPYFMAHPGDEAVVVLANVTAHDVTTRLLLPLDLSSPRSPIPPPVGPSTTRARSSTSRYPVTTNRAAVTCFCTLPAGLAAVFGTGNNRVSRSDKKAAN